MSLFDHFNIHDIGVTGKLSILIKFTGSSTGVFWTHAGSFKYHIP